MSTNPTDLLPEDLIEDALAPERPDANAFAAGVAQRIAEREAEESADPGGFDAARRGWPTWLKQAASILPPGFVDLALLGKFGGGGVAKSAPVAGWIAAPWAILLLAAASLVGAMRLTSRLDASRTQHLDEAPGRRPTAGRLSFALFTAALVSLPFLALLWAAVHDLWFLAAGVFLLCAVGVLAFVLRLSRAGLADRRAVGGLVSGLFSQFIAVGFMLPVFLRELAGPLTVYGLPFLLILGLLGSRGLVDGFRSTSFRIAAPICLGIAVLLPLVNRIAIEVPFGAHPEELEAWVEEFDLPVSELNEWWLLGQARRALGEERFDRLDLEGARRQLRLGFDEAGRLHPKTGVGAWRAGLLTPAELASFRRAEGLVRNQVAHGEATTYLRNSDLLGILAMTADGTLSPERRAFFGRAIERSLPEPGEHGAIESAHVALDYALALGIEDYPVRHRERLLAILAAAFDPVGRSYAEAGGFGNLLTPEDGGEAFLATDTKDTLLAVELLARVGVPERVDLGLVDAYLGDEMLSSPRSGPLIGNVEAAFARHLLRERLPVPPPSPLAHLRRESIFLTALLLVTLSLWIVWRAPVVPRAARRRSAGPHARPSEGLPR